MPKKITTKTINGGVLAAYLDGVLSRRYAIQTNGRRGPSGRLQWQVVDYSADEFCGHASPNSRVVAAGLAKIIKERGE